MIGVFDSGIGGLSVLEAVARELPLFDLMYFADTAHIPYGTKSDLQIQQRVLRIGTYLAEQGCFMIVVACNTATAAAVTALRKNLPDIPVVGVEPGIKPAAKASKSKRIAVLATESTARSERLAQLIRLHAGAVHVDIVPCPGWATQVETLKLDDPDFSEAARALLIPVLEAGADRIVLGCTHYAFLSPLLRPIVDGQALLVDVADAVAKQCRRLAGSMPASRGRLELRASGRPERLELALSKLGLMTLESRLSGHALPVTV